MTETAEYLDLTHLRDESLVGYIKETTVEQTYTLHTHAFPEVFLVLRGMAIHHVNGEDQLVQKGSLVLMRPRDAHCYRAFNGHEFRMISCGFAQEYLDAACAYLKIDPADWNEGTLPHSVLTDDATLSHMEHLLDGLVNLRGQMRGDYLRAVLPQILHSLTQSTTTQAPPLPAWLSELVQSMNEPENFCAGLDRMLKLANCSQEHLTRAFHRYVGLTPTQFINRKRAEYAAELLCTTDLAVLDIGYACGFGGTSSFYESFKKLYDCSPTRYRSLYGRAK